MSCCDEYCSNYGCNQGRDCPVRKSRYMDIIVYTKSGCPNCVSAKQLLQTKGLDFHERSTDVEHVRQELLAKFPDIRQMPAIFINEQFVGGFAGLQAALKQLDI